MESRQFTRAQIAAGVAIALSIAGPLSATAGAPSRGSYRESRTSVRIEGRYEAGQAPGTFVQVIDPATGRFRSSIATGPFHEELGYDGSPWLGHDGTVVPIDMTGAVADIRARAFLLRAGWRYPSLRRFMQKSKDRRPGAAVRIAVRLPGTSFIDLFFLPGASDPQRAVVAGDAGPVAMDFEDWRSIGRLCYAFRRTEKDATGQVTRYLATTATSNSADVSWLGRPVSHPRGTLTAAPRAVPFVKDHGDQGHIVVPAQINGRSAKLIFDTGAANFVTPKVAAAYGLAVSGAVNVGGIGATSVEGGFTRITELVIGPARLRDTVAIVAPLPDAATNPRPGLNLQGLAGLEFLTEFRTTIDYGLRTLSFATHGGPLPPGSSVPFRTDGGSIFVALEVDGRSGWFRLDTGDGGTLTLFKTFAEQTRVAPVGGSRVDAGQVGGDVAYHETRLRSVRLGALRFRNVDAQVSEQTVGAFSPRTIAGNFGAGLLTKLRLVIDFPSRTIVLSQSDATGVGDAERNRVSEGEH